MNVVLLGSGNVATHLGIALKASGSEILQVYSRNPANAGALANKLDVESISDFSKLSPDAVIYILVVSDTAIPELVENFPFRDKLLVHTSGTTGIDVIQNASDKTGVFYPLQTFSKTKAVDFSGVPILIEGNSSEVVEILTSLATQVSRKVIPANSHQRQALHVAAVLACNFSNHLYSLAEEVLKDHELDFDLIRPLIAETAAKVQEILPEEAQTGPAVRNDNLTIIRHLDFLQNKPELRRLYKLFTESIITKHNSP